MFTINSVEDFKMIVKRVLEVAATVEKDIRTVKSFNNNDDDWFVGIVIEDDEARNMVTIQGGRNDDYIVADLFFNVKEKDVNLLMNEKYYGNGNLCHLVRVNEEFTAVLSIRRFIDNEEDFEALVGTVKFMVMKTS
jgi:hypothetical protein